MKKHCFSGCLKEKAFKVGNCQRRRFDDGDKPLFGICDDFILDYAKIIQSKGFRRLMNKTQVFYSSDNPHVRSRMTHTMEVATIAVTIASALGLNTNLAQAIAVGHDLGHVPFGHVGEKFLSEFTIKPFKHNLFGPIIAEKVERWGKGLNITEETLNGIKLHSGADFKKNFGIEEYKVVQLADKISYLFSDLNDAIRFGYLTPLEMPSCFKELGSNQRSRVNNCLLALFNESSEKGLISFSEKEEAILYNEARNWMFKEIYPRANERIAINDLQLAFEIIREDFLLQKYDPIVIFSIFTEDAIVKIARERAVSDQIKYDFGIFEVTPSLEQDKVYCDDFALKPELI